MFANVAQRVLSTLDETVRLDCTWLFIFSGRGRSHGPHKFYIPVVPRRHSFDERIFAVPVGGLLIIIFFHFSWN